MFCYYISSFVLNAQQYMLYLFYFLFSCTPNPPNGGSWGNKFLYSLVFLISAQVPLMQSSIIYNIFQCSGNHLQPLMNILCKVSGAVLFLPSFVSIIKWSHCSEKIGRRKDDKKLAQTCSLVAGPYACIHMPLEFWGCLIYNNLNQVICNYEIWWNNISKFLMKSSCMHELWPT